MRVFGIDIDSQHVDVARREIKIVGDGACPPSLAGKAGPAGFAEHGIPTEGGAGGLSVKLVCGIPFWPHAFVTVDADMERLIHAWSNEYAVLGCGEQLYDDLSAAGS